MADGSVVDPDGLQEYSVVFTDRVLNHMSQRFQKVMRELSATLRQVYHADAVALVPGGGSYGMEAVARQFAHDKKCLVIRNGWFSYRWTQIFESCGIVPSHEVLKAQRIGSGDQAAFAPPAIEAVEAAIAQGKPDLVFAPHVETASGIVLPDDYLRRVAAAVHAHGGLFILDCVASGALWVDMKACGVDVLLTAPQKAWSAPPSCAVVLFSAAAEARLGQTKSSSFANDLGKWRQIMQAYENGGHAYHCTVPTTALVQFNDAVQETVARGLDHLRQQQISLGEQVRALLAEHGFASVAAEGFASPTVVVSYTEDADVRSGARFVQAGLQAAAGVPLACDEGEAFSTFRIGLFGLDKLGDVDGTVARLRAALRQMGV